MNKIIVFFAIIAMIGLSIFFISISGGINARNTAKAYATQSRTNQREADAEFARSVKIEKEAERVAVWNDTYMARIATITLWIGVLALSGMIFIATTGVSASVYIAKLSVIKTRQLNMQSMMVLPDSTTGMFPMIFDNPDNPRFAFNPNNGSVYRLDERTEPNEQMIASSSRVQEVGLVARNNGGSQVVVK